MTKVVFEKYLDRYITEVDKKYWDYLDFLTILIEARIERRNLKELFAFHFASDDAVTPIRKTFYLGKTVDSDKALENQGSIEKRIDRYKQDLRKLGIDINYILLDNCYVFDMNKARKKLDWHYGVKSRYTDSMLDKLYSSLQDITCKDLRKMISHHNLAMIVQGLFERGIAEEQFVSPDDICLEFSDGLFASVGLSGFVSCFKNPELLLPIAYPNLFIPPLRENKYSRKGLDSMLSSLGTTIQENEGKKLELKMNCVFKGINDHSSGFYFNVKQ